MPLRERQRRARRDWILEHVLAVILILTAGAFLVIMLIMLATRL
jgi:succinate dehydrogenase hydrophobic anchor subunit